jgi:hypothetical protein
MRQVPQVGRIELTASRGKEAFRLLLALIPLVGTIFALSVDGDTSGPTWPLWLGLPLWLAAFLMFGWQVVKPPRLILDNEGFTFTGRIRSTQKVAWRDIEEFFVWYSGRGNRFIAYNLKPEARSNTVLAKVNHRFGADGILPSIWPMSAENLATKLNAVRQGGLGMELS